MPARLLFKHTIIHRIIFNVSELTRLARNSKGLKVFKEEQILLVFELVESVPANNKSLTFSLIGSINF